MILKIYGGAKKLTNWIFDIKILGCRPSWVALSLMIRNKYFWFRY